MTSKNLFPTITLAAIFCVAPGALGQTTQKLSATKANEYALIYSLPKTVIDVTVETEHVTREPGEFYNYAKRHLGIDNAITTSSEDVTVKSVTLNTRGVADGSNRWQVKFKAGSTPTMILTDDGVPLSINVDKVTLPAAPVLPVAKDAAPGPLETEAARQAITLDMTRSSSLSKKAELAAQRIFELRESRNELISGNADNTPPDGKSMQLALDNLSAQEAALTAMFAGTEKHSTKVTTVTVTPDSADIDNMVIARVSPVEGVVDVDDLSGEPMTLSINVLEHAKLPVNEKGEVKAFPKGGVAYTIPGVARVDVKFRGKTIATATIDLAQAGATFGLDPAMFTDKKAPAYVTFSPVTGGVTHLGTVE